MQTKAKKQKAVSNFSNELNLSFDWFSRNFKNNIEESFCDFWERDFDVKFLCLSENTNFLAQNEEFFVTKIRLNKELSVFVRLSKNLVKNLVENTLGSNGKRFDINKISELEAKILTGFNNYMYKSFASSIKQSDELPKNNTNYNEYNLTFFVESCGDSLGKLVVKIPVVAINPEKLTLKEETFGIDDFLSTKAKVNLCVGSTKIKLSDLKNLEKDDIVLLENSKASQMILKYDGHKLKMRVTPNPGIMIDYDIEENGAGSGGEKYMSGNYNMWDTIQVEIGAEFEKVKLTLGELKQISEGLVVDIGSVYDNKIDLKVEDKIVASGELVIINDRYGVKINHIFTEEKNLASQNVEEAQYEKQLEDDPVVEQQENYPQEQVHETPEVPAQHSDEVNEEDFDYSDFDVDEEDI